MWSLVTVDGGRRMTTQPFSRDYLEYVFVQPDVRAVRFEDGQKLG